MSVALELRVPPGSFGFGAALATDADVRVELERVVPLGTAEHCFVRASGSDSSGFERAVREHDRTVSLVPVDAGEEQTLYRFEWASDVDGVLAAARETSGVVVRATLDREWRVRLRFPDHERLSAFHERCTEGDVRLSIERVAPTAEDSEDGERFGLSTAQREALVRALERGYFDTPSRVSLVDLAEEFDISHQALSSRIRRGEAEILRQVLQPAEAEREPERPSSE